VPGVAPAAIQMGKFAARQIRRSLENKPRELFEYLDKGSLATIGRSHAIADLPGKIHISGYFAWLAWLFVHSARLITERSEREPVETPKAKVG
jgi:NADH dehydrogenase